MYEEMKSRQTLGAGVVRIRSSTTSIRSLGILGSRQEHIVVRRSQVLGPEVVSEVPGIESNRQGRYKEQESARASTSNTSTTSSFQWAKKEQGTWSSQELGPGVILQLPDE